jgi:serine/threonine-protein kinase
MPGESLETLLATRFPSGMDEDEALDLIRPIVRTLETLHTPWTTRSGHVWHCVYQDLKPANIIVSPSGRASLLDFGGCQVVIDGVPVLEGARTPGYAPPECEGPARVLLPRADVYGLGGTLYHMLSGTDPRDRLARHRGQAGGHLNVADLPGRVSPGLRRVLARCLAPRPSDRFADARQVALALWGSTES